MIKNPIRNVEEYEAAESEEHFLDVSSTEIVDSCELEYLVFETASGNYTGKNLIGSVLSAVNAILTYFVY